MSAPFVEESTVMARTQVLTAEVADEAVMLDAEDGLYYGLDEVGTVVWNALDEPRSIGELRAAIRAEFDVSAERCANDLAEFLAELAAEGLVEVREDDAA